MLKVIGIGDNVCDMYIHTGRMYPGGQALNVSVYAKRLGAISAYMGVFGRDAVAAHIVSVLDEEGVEHDRCRHYEGENGYAVVDLVDGDRVFVRSNKGGVSRERPLEFSDEDLLYIKGFDLVHTSNNSYIDDRLARLSLAEVPLSYDFSGAWKDTERLKRVCAYLSYAFLSCGELSVTEASELCAAARDYGCGIVVATMGDRGALLYDGHRTYRQSPLPVEAVDTLGAGDAFAAGFLVSFARMRKEDPVGVGGAGAVREHAIAVSLERGARLASDTCLSNGAFGHGVRFAAPS